MSYQNVLILNFPKIALDAPPLAPALLSEICDKNNIKHDFVDCNLEFFQNLNNNLKDEILGLYAERFIEKLSDHAQSWLDQYFTQLAIQCQNYDLIAISVFSSHSISLVNYFLKNHRKQINADIVVGGAGIASNYTIDQKFYQHLKQQNLIDYWILGEGEVGFNDLLLKKFTSESINNTKFNSLENFELVPIPNFDKFKINDYLYNGKKIVGVEGSRGCVKKCTFCNIQNTWGRYKYKDGHILANEILTLKNKYNIDHFWFNDSLINGSLKSFREFIKHLANNRQDNFTWSSQAIIRQKTIRDEEDFKLLKASGCETLAVGIESFSQSVRFHMGKKFTDDDLENFLNLAQKYNIMIFVLLIVGYPTETQKDFDYTLKQLEKYQHLSDDGTISGIRIGGTMNITPDLPIYNSMDEIGINYTDDTIYKHVTWAVGENTLKQRVKWRLDIEDYARHLGYNCADKEMSVEQTLLNFLKTIDS